MNDIIYRRMVEELDRMTLSAKAAMDSGDWRSCHYWLSMIDKGRKDLDAFMETHLIGG